MKGPGIQYAVGGLMGLCALGFLASLIIIGWGYSQIYGIGGWRDEVYGLQGMVASDRAMRDFRAGHLRLYRPGGESEEAKFTGTNEGPFEVWIPQFYPSLGSAHRYSTDQFIEFYDRKMHYMFSHPEKFRASNEGPQPEH